MESKWNFLRNKFGHQLVAANLTKSNTAAKTPLGLGFDFTTLILNQTIELKWKGKDRKAQSALQKQHFFIKFCNQTYKYFVSCFLLYVKFKFLWSNNSFGYLMKQFGDWIIGYIWWFSMPFWLKLHWIWW